MNVMKWSLVEYSSLKSDLQFPEFSKESGPRRQLPLAWAIGDQLICGFGLKPEIQAFSISPGDLHSNVDYFFEFNPDLSLVQISFLLQSPLFSNFFDQEYFFSQWGKGQKESLIRIVPHILAFPLSFLFWLHDKDVRASDLAPLRAISPENIQFFTQVFLQCRPSKSEGVQILEHVVDLCLMSLSEQKITECFSSSASETLKQLKLLRYPHTAHRDQDLKENLKISWPANVQARYQRRGDKSGFDLQVFVSNSNELKKTVIHLEKAIEEWKSLSQNH